MKIGVDIEEVARFEEIGKKNKIDSFFSDDEIKYCKSRSKPLMHFAGIFCAKEAVKKTLNRNVLIRDIEIGHSENGAPFIVRVEEDENLKELILLSISHTEKYAVANALNLKDE